MAKGKDILTTGEVAKICNVASRTVSRWFDEGLLKGWRLPLSGDRRVKLSELIQFMKEHDIPYEKQKACLGHPLRENPEAASPEEKLKKPPRARRTPR